MAFAVYVQAVRTSDGERILPAIMNDNYFTLMPGETKDICITLMRLYCKVVPINCW